jgi:hypothetical protein
MMGEICFLQRQCFCLKKHSGSGSRSLEVHLLGQKKDSYLLKTPIIEDEALMVSSELAPRLEGKEPKVVSQSVEHCGRFLVADRMYCESSAKQVIED